MAKPDAIGVMVTAFILQGKETEKKDGLFVKAALGQNGAQLSQQSLQAAYRRPRALAWASTALPGFGGNAAKNSDGVWVSAG